MIKKINLKRKDGKIIQGILKKLDESYINRIMRFQDEIVEGLENKELYFPSKEEEFLQFISNKGNIIGCVTEDDDLIAIGVYCKLGYDEDNYGYDIGINGEELLKVGRGKEIKEIFNGKMDIKAPGGESLRNLYDRVGEALENILKNSINKKILIVAHGMTLKAVMNYFNKGNGFYKEIMGQASLTKINCYKDKFQFEYINDTSHINKKINSGW